MTQKYYPQPRDNSVETLTRELRIVHNRLYDLQNTMAGQGESTPAKPAADKPNDQLLGLKVSPAPLTDGYVLTYSGSGGNLQFIAPASGTPPAHSAAPGNPGQLAYDAGFLYICVAPNTWRRVAVAAF